MRTFEDDLIYPEPLYRGGSYLVSLRRPVHWYIKRACSKGKTFGTTHVSTIMPLLVDKIFGKSVDQEEIDLSLNLDCMVNSEAEYVQKELEYMILSEIISYFPKIAAELPEELYQLNEMDLVINVPELYEQQRGYFF